MMKMTTVKQKNLETIQYKHEYYYSGIHTIQYNTNTNIIIVAFIQYNTIQTQILL